MNKKSWVEKLVGKIVGFIMLAIAMALLLGYVVMLLWNHVLAAVVSVSVITFWQALGLLVLSKILFGGGCWGRHKNGHWKNEMKEKWQSMTPEEREKIKQEWRNRCGVWKRNSSEPSAGAE